MLDSVRETAGQVEGQERGGQRRRILFICGSLNQTSQMHQIARQLPEHEHAFTPYYVDGALELARRARLLEFTVAGHKLRRRCLAYLEKHHLPLDIGGRGEKEASYDLVLSCSDLVVPRNLWDRRVVLVQEGILDPAGPAFRLCRRFPALPRWLAGTATTGLSGRFDRFCVASEGYRDLFVANGVDPARIVVTGIPNFDDCRRYSDNGFPYRNFILVCSSDARETWKRDDRLSFIARCREMAAGRGSRLIWKLHPNENAARATREIEAVAPGTLVYATGSAEEMIANCDVLVTQWSSTAFVGLALGKEVHSYFSQEELERLLPLQNRAAAANIAAVCRALLGDAAQASPHAPAAPPPVERAKWPHPTHEMPAAVYRRALHG
jgi:hypothetical protein